VRCASLHSITIHNQLRDKRRAEESVKPTVSNRVQGLGEGSEEEEVSNKTLPAGQKFPKGVQYGGGSSHTTIRHVDTLRRLVEEPPKTREERCAGRSTGLQSYAKSLPSRKRKQRMTEYKGQRDKY